MASLAPAVDNVESPASSDGEDASGVPVNSSDQWVTRCICVNNSQVEGFMIECERCQVWQHGDCVRVDKGKVPDEYFCELCRPELHDARGLWTGGVRNQATGKVAVSRSSSSKKKKTKSRKQSTQGANPASGPSANSAGEGSNDNAMIDVRGVSGHPEPNPPGAVAPESTANGVEDDQKNLSREERKIVKIMQTIQMMEDRDKKRRRSGGTSATPDPQAPSNKGQSADEQTSKRRKSRSTSSSKPSPNFSIPVLAFDGYDVEHLKTSPALLRNLFPVSPMYLGSKVFLLQQMAMMENASNGAVSFPGTPIIHHKERSVSRPSADDRPRRGARSPSPASCPGPSNLSANSSPFSSQPISPAGPPGPESPVNMPACTPASSLPSSENAISAVQTADVATTSGVVPNPSDVKPILATIPRLSSIPKVSVNPSRSSENGIEVPPIAAIPKMGMFTPVPIPPIAVSGAVTPLSSLSELMQSYMNAPPTEFNPPSHLDLSRYKVGPGGVLPPPSVPLVPQRWGLDHSGTASQLPMPAIRYVPGSATAFSARQLPAPSSAQTNNQQSHPS